MARLIATGIGLLLACMAAAAEPMAACPAASHRFETFALPAPSLGRPKRVLVYLPPGYDCEVHRRYPTFYFNDGHDLFDWNPFAAELDPALAAEIGVREGWYGSWRLDAQLDRAATDGNVPPLIVIGIASDDGLRSRDLAPVPWDGSAEGRGAEYGEFVAQTVVPAVNRRYRSIAERRCRGIGGASLGGVSALQIGLSPPDTFGRVVAFSPVHGVLAITSYLAAIWRIVDQPGRSDFLVDFDDDRLGTADWRWFASLSVAAPAADRHLTLIQTPGGRHGIASWAERVIPALHQLLAARCPA